MKRTLAFLAAALLAAPAFAQIQQITTTRTSNPNGSFSIGPRISNYSTDLEGGIATLKTGRQSAFGIVGDYRNGNLVLDFQWDRDPQNGIRLTDLIIDVGNYERNHGEFTVGYAIAPMIDIQGGARYDSIRVGGASIFGNSILTDLDMENTALTGGLRIHSDETQQASFYALARGFVGSAKFDAANLVNATSDTSGYRGEVGVPIRLGESNWRIVPGFEYDHLETKDFGITMNTNRAFLNFVYRSK